MSDFDYAILEHTSHRPWPMPERAWVMTQTWHDLLFAHWPVEAAALRPLIPPAFDMDLFDGRAWIGVVPFRMSNVAPRGVPALPWVSAFPELNVRTYVRVGSVAGVYFFSLDAGNPVVVAAARALFHLPYYSADISIDSREGWVRYESRRVAGKAPAASFVARYRPTAPAAEPVADSLDHFLTERYCLFTTNGASRAYRVDIHHPPWALAAAEMSSEVNTMAEAAGIRLPPLPPLLHFAQRQDVVAWPPAALEL